MLAAGGLGLPNRIEDVDVKTGRSCFVRLGVAGGGELGFRVGGISEYNVSVAFRGFPFWSWWEGGRGAGVGSIGDPCVEAVESMGLT